MKAKFRILVLGASYGSLLSTKLLLSGHAVTLVCTRPTADLINREGTLVRFPVKGREEVVEVHSKQCKGQLSARAPDEVDPAHFQLVVLAMQEPQYGAQGVRQLVTRIAEARTPCLAIMNMPPLPYLARISSLSIENLGVCYTDSTIWEGFDPTLVTLASPDAQAFRPPDRPRNVLHVGLPTNFKAARFASEEATALLRNLEADIDDARLTLPAGEIELPVKLKVHESIFVPLAKWPMLMTGNYRCIRSDAMISIKDAVHGNIAKSQEIYDWVAHLCCELGAERADLVPFEKYAKAAEGLGKPSSAARALFSGALRIERVDKLVSCIARQLELDSETLNEIVALVDERLERNRLSDAERLAAA